MKLHNTLSRTVEEFVPQTAGEVNLYTCGPTVYNFAHIGNLRAFTFYDVLRRTLESQDLKVKHTMNITDVGHLTSDADEGEDKMEKGAAREGTSVWDVAASYTDAFKADMAAMNILPPNSYQSEKYGDTYARATEFIDEQIKLVQLLLDKDFAYITEQAIYFDVTKLPDYGVLTGQKLADKEVASRADVVTDPDKRGPYDFSVWFFTVGKYADHSMQWPSPWGNGFPGWHLECSAIIHGTLGDPIDIHTGGIDHIGTHHPNEMAQTEAAYGHKLANFWVHNEFILVDGAKMSKSLGNAYTLADITARGFSPLALRVLYLQAHYRGEINFTWDSLTAAQNTLINLYAWADLKHQDNLNEVRLGESVVNDLIDRIKAALANDLSTTAALGEIFRFSTAIAPGMTYDIDDFNDILEQLEALFGLSLTNRPDIDDKVRALITERETARDNRDWPGADKLRNQLRKHNIEVSDTPNGTRWSRSSLI